MDKLGRNYSLDIAVQLGEGLTIALPFTIEFDITRTTLSSANVAQIRVYNLSLNNRKKIYKNPMDFDQFKHITLKAGYGKNIPIVFDGDIREASSVREGVNFITQIDCFDAGFAFVNGVADIAFPEGFAFKDVIRTIASTSLPNVSVGAIGSFPGALVRGNTYNGNAADQLRQITGGGFFVDNGKFYAMGDSEAIQGEIEVITSDSGLLGTPRRYETYLTFDMLFEPRLTVGQKILLDSSTGSNFNGEYKVVSLHHKGMISDAVCGPAITTVGLFYGTESLTMIG